MTMETAWLDKVPDVLLSYQKRWVGDTSDVKLVEKGRRTGITWGEAADDVLIAATEGKAGMDVLYIGYNQEMTREYVDTCGFWARHFQKAAGSVEEFLFDDEGKDIKAFRIEFTSGYEVLALSSAPRNLRGRQGRVVIDEAAFHDDLRELLKAAMALLMWGGQVVIISTHNGDDNAFNELVEDVRAGKLPYSLHRVTFDDALDEGLFERICLVRGKEWSPEAEAKWRADIINKYGDSADEELFCIPSRSGGAYLTRNIIEACMNAEAPVLRWQPPAKDFVDWPLDQAFREVRDWCEAELAPVLAGIPSDVRSYFGEDFGRSGDLTVLWPLLELQNLALFTPFVLELRNAPFRTQEQILFFLVDRLPRFSAGALDARGNGQALAEYARQRYGAYRIHEVMLSESWYREQMPKAKAQFEDRTISIPKDRDILDDLRAFKMVKGVARIPDARTQDAAGQRHGDAGVACALAVFAAKSTDKGPLAYGSAEPAERPRMTQEVRAGSAAREEDETFQVGRIHGDRSGLVGIMRRAARG